MKPTRLALCAFFILHSTFCISAQRVFPELTQNEKTAIAAAIPESARATPAKPRRLLVFYRTEGFVHNSIPNANYALEHMGKLTGAFSVTLSDDMAQFDPATLNTYDAVLFNNTTQLKFENPAYRQALLDFVRSGKGLIGIHAGSDNFPTWPEGQALMGGVFHSHPWVSKDTVAVKNDDPEHILNTAFEKRGFWITEEIYQIVGPYSREKQRVLLSLDMSRPENKRPADKIVRTDDDFPISWLKTEGTGRGGRVFYTSLGHNKNIFETPQILQHILDGIQYALGDLEADAVPSAKLSPQPTPALAPDDKTTLQTLAAKRAATRESGLSSPLTAPPPPSLSSLAAYTYGDPLAPQLAYEQYLRTATVDQRAAVEKEILEILSPANLAGKSGTLAAKRVFLNWLGWIGTEKSMPTLIVAAGNSDLAYSAIRALGSLNARTAEVALANLTRATNPEPTRIEALNALGQRRASLFITDIAKLTTSESPAVSNAALEALANIATPEAITALQALDLSGSDELPRARALVAATANLLRREPTSKNRSLAIKTYSETLRTVNNLTAQIETAQALVSLDPVNPALFIFPMDSDARLRAVIGCGMATSGNPEAIQLITENFSQIPADTQARMLTALVTKPAATARPLIDLALEDKNTGVQLAAIAASASCGDETTVAKLAPLLSSENKDLLTAALAALTQLPDCEGKTNAALHKLLFAAPTDTAAQLLRVLASRQDHTVFSTALANTQFDNDALRAASFEAVALLVRPEDLPQILPLAANIKRAPERREWTKALYASAASHPDAAEAVTLIQKQLAAAGTADRATLIVALTMIKSPDAKAALDALLTSSESATRKETLRALAAARTQTAYDLLVARSTAATDDTERLLAQRGAIDTVDQLELSAKEKVAHYETLWKLADRQEEKDAIIAALKRTKNSAATELLKKIAPAK